LLVTDSRKLDGETGDERRCLFSQGKDFSVPAPLSGQILTSTVVAVHTLEAVDACRTRALGGGSAQRHGDLLCLVRGAIPIACVFWEYLPTRRVSHGAEKTPQAMNK
jgi:hypothetical protein